MSKTNVFSDKNKKEKRYSDLALNFGMSPVTGNISRVTDEQSVKQALKTLLLTTKGERFYRKDYGSAIHNLLFDMIDDITADTIRMSIEEAIQNYEPRVDAFEVSVTPDYTNSQYKVNLIFRIINIPEIQQLDLVLRRVR